MHCFLHKFSYHILADIIITLFLMKVIYWKTQTCYPQESNTSIHVFRRKLNYIMSIIDVNHGRTHQQQLLFCFCCIFCLLMVWRCFINWWQTSPCCDDKHRPTMWCKFLLTSYSLWRRLSIKMFSLNNPD